MAGRTVTPFFLEFIVPGSGVEAPVEQKPVFAVEIEIVSEMVIEAKASEFFGGDALVAIYESAGN